MLVVVVNHTVLVEVANRGQILGILVAARYSYIVRSLCAGLVEQILPVGVGVVVRIGAVTELAHLIVGVLRSQTYRLTCLVPSLGDFGRTHERRVVGRVGHTDETLIGHLGFAALTALGGDEDDAVGSLRTVD